MVYIRRIIMLFAALSFALSAYAQEPTGVVKGRVSNAGTGQYLKNAVVTVDGTGIKIRTEDDGSFRITDLPVGPQTIMVTYTGLDTEKLTIEVVATEEKTLDFDLTSDVYVLGQYVVSAEREGSAKAIQQQRESDTAKNIVASDSFGNMVDGNVGELMKNLPGIAIDYDGEDAAKMRFRGMDPSQMSVTMNGNSVASINGTDNDGNDQKASRSFALKDFPVQNIESIEVFTAPTPAQPSNNLGGSVNFVMKNAFDQKGRRIRLDSNLSLNSTTLDFQKLPGGGRTPDRKVKPGFNFNYSEAFGKIHPIGINFVANYTPTYRFNNKYDLPGGYTFNANELTANNQTATATMGGTIPSVQWTERGQSNQRKYIALNLDFKLSDSTVLYLYTSYSIDTGLGTYEHRFRIGGGTQPDSSSFDTFLSTAGTTVAATSTVSNNDTKTWNINGGVKHRFGSFELSYDGFISRASYLPSREKNYYVTYGMNSGPGIKITGISGNATGQVTQLSGSDYTNLANYNSLILYNDYYYGTDTQLGGKIDAKYPFHLFGMPVVAQAGLRFNEGDRITKRYFKKYDLTGNSGSDTFLTASEPTLTQFTDGYFFNKWDFNVAVPNWVSPYKVWDYYASNPEKFYDTPDMYGLAATAPLARMLQADRYSRERIYAGYGMATMKPVNSLTFIVGARYEYTDLLARGYQFDSTPSLFNIGHPLGHYNGLSDEEKFWLFLIKRVRATKNYDRLFPNAQAKWEPLKDLIVRGAYTTGMGRPDLGQILPGKTVYQNYNLIKMTNPKLLPQTNTNYDLKVEYYLPKSGQATLGVFHQDINRYIYTQDVVITDYPNPYTGESEIWDLQQPQNGGKGKNDGVELSYRQRLGFIAKWLDKFEFYTAFSRCNPTFKYLHNTAAVPSGDDLKGDTDAVDTYLNSPTELVSANIPGIVKKTANARLTYNGSKFSGSVAVIWRGEYVRSINTTNKAETIQAAAYNVDLSLGYKLSPRWLAYFDWRNATNTADERHIFNRTGGYYTSGMAINLGIRADL